MVETTRAHERLAPRALAGDTLTFTGPGGRAVALFVPDRARTRDTVPLVVHFHGAAWIAQQAGAALDDGTLVAVVNLGAGSSAYHRAYIAPAAFDTLLQQVQAEARARTGRRTTLGDVVLSAFSAGHGAVRVILREPRHAARVQGVLLLDGLHTSYVPEGRPLADGGTLDSLNLVAIRDYARRAMHADAAGGVDTRRTPRLLITHSTIFPGTYASTTETADWLLASLGLRRTAVLAWGPRGMQQLSEVSSRGVTLLGFAGNSAPDHVDHLHAMPELLARLRER